MGLVYFLLYMFLEILFSYEFAAVFTPLGLFLEIIFTAFVGVYIIRMLPFSMQESIQKVMSRQIDEQEFISIGLFKFIGAVLLIIPGVFTDILGILMLIEPFARWIVHKFLPKKEFEYNNFNNDYKTDDDIIDVEIIEEIGKKN